MLHLLLVAVGEIHPSFWRTAGVSRLVEPTSRLTPAVRQIRA
jgi:hypothetical protein